MNIAALRRHPKATGWAIFAALLLYALWPLTYSAESIDARLVDAETNEPIAGAIVVAHWELVSSFEGGFVVGHMMVMEAETDTNGHFHFPAWGPKPVPLYRQLARLEFRDPALLIFKPGYQMGEKSNDKTSKQLAKRGPERRFSQYDGKTITLRKVDRFSTRYRENLSFLNGRLMSITGSGCDWQRTPKMILALRDEGRRFTRHHLYSDIYQNLIGNETYMKEHGCRSPREFFAGHEK